MASHLISDRHRHSRWGILDGAATLTPLWAPFVVLLVTPDLRAETRATFMLLAAFAGALVCAAVVRRVLRDSRADRRRR